MDTKHHQIYQTWMKELDFYEEEMSIFQKELNLLIERHPELLSILEHVEEYQHIFAKKNDKINLLRTQIQAKQRIITPSSLDGNGPVWDFGEIQKKQKSFVKRMESLKQNFKRFVAKNMH